MKIFRELLILTRDIERLKNELMKFGYVAKYVDDAFVSKEMITFCKQDICIFLNVEKMNIINIIRTKRSINMDEYNELLLEFGSAVQSAGFKVKIFNDEISIQERLSQESANAFLSFSNSANKSTGHSHPYDKERWFSFLYSMINNDINNELSFDEARGFFVEYGWSEDMACELARDMEYGLSAMKYALK